MEFLKAKILANPFIIYSIAFLLVIVIYPLGWSNLYPQLSFGLICFLGATIIINFFIGILFHKVNFFSYKSVNYSKRKIWIVTLLIQLGYLFEFAYMRVVPIIAISTGAEYEYTSFGVPTFHVILVTFNSFWAVFIFHNIVAKNTKNLVLPYILCLIPSILIFNRGMFLLILASSLFVAIMGSKKIYKLMFRISIVLIVILFLFGFAGNIRVSGGNSANDIIMGIGNATEKFEKSSIPKEFFWAYLYITSPLANLQETIDIHRITPASFDKVPVFINSEILPDFIHKRNESLFKRIEYIDQVSESLTVGTIYGRSFAYYGYWGLTIMFLYILFFNFITILVLSRNSIYFVSGIAILNCIMLFNIFDNMFTFAGLVLQLIYPIVLGAFSRIRFNSTSIKNLSLN
jgi:oligosaccharide repeat unit polymerase